VGIDGMYVFLFTFKLTMNNGIAEVVIE